MTGRWGIHNRHNYIYKYTPRVTTRINTKSTKTLISEYRSVRRQEINRSINLGNKIHIEIQPPTKELVDIYVSMFKEQGNEVSKICVQRLKSLIDSKCNNLDKYLCLNADGDIMSYAIFYTSETTSYYLIGAVSPRFRKANVMSHLLNEAFNNLREVRDIDHIDMVGINSPHRGDFKSSFGGESESYIENNITVI